MEPSKTPPKLARKTVEKNRRLYLKSLYSKLDSLLPNTTPTSPRSSEGVALPDKLEEVIRYIKILRNRVERLKEKKIELLGGGRCESSTASSSGSWRIPHVDVQDLGSGLIAVFMSSPSDCPVFFPAMVWLEDQGAEVVNANFTISGDKALHTIHCTVSQRGLDTGEMAQNLTRVLYSSDL